MRIQRKFVKLTQRTYPHGTEHLLERFLPFGYKKDRDGNYFISVGTDYTTMFTCHLDTVSHSCVNVKHVFDGDIIRTNGSSILGADDKAGMVVLLYMIENMIPGLYYFFLGEERGCIGSGLMSKNFPSALSHIKKVISFDRKGKTSVITHQMSGRSCSDLFAEALSYQLNNVGIDLKYKPDDTGIYTDSAEFVDLIPECTNISVGYQNEHTTSECQDINHLSKLCKACVLVNWESLPIDRKPGENDFYDYDDEDDDLDDELTEIVQEYNESNYAYINYDGTLRKKVYVSTTRILYETNIIEKTLTKKGYELSKVSWNGNSCWVKEKTGDGMTYIGTRDEVMQFVQELCEIPQYHYKYDLNKNRVTFHRY